MKTTKLRNGTIVLAHKDGYAKTYVNLTQAKTAAAKNGGQVYQAPMSRVFYVMMVA